MEPLMIGENAGQRGELTDLALVLAQQSTGLGKSLPSKIVGALASLVRSMNCYYSNLIEGHDTHPIDIERALDEDFSSDPKQRDLQLEAKAHIAVQEWIDEGGLDGRVTQSEALLETHRRFCELVPNELLWVENPETKQRERVIPGALRESDIIVGSHVGISPSALPRFMCRFEEAYHRLGKLNSILATAAAHHRLLWIHPFLDGNGRVARLMSYAMLRETLDTGGIWSIARGLARNESEYKQHLSNCDLPRRNDLDGRGELSEEALAEFTKFFLKVCIDQVDFMEELMQPQRLRDRIMIWCEEEIRANGLSPKSGKILSTLILQGELERGDVAELLNTGERSAQRVTKILLDQGIIKSQSTRAPLHLAFPASLASRWMPGLFPDK
jgi:Fic family protein|tara:strand:- start:17299 stop:18456 length:1158 start_codon:yes stop_codon:yes gene_type:complete